MGSLASRRLVPLLPLNGAEWEHQIKNSHGHSRLGFFKNKYLVLKSGLKNEEKKVLERHLPPPPHVFLNGPASGARRLKWADAGSRFLGGVGGMG